jgi:hypothetical protein
MHVPAFSSLIVAPLVPLEVHTEVVVAVKVTVKPEEAVALTVKGDCASVLFASAPKAIVWEALVTVKLTALLELEPA